MITYKVKDKYKGMIITLKPLPHMEAITLDTTKTQDLFELWKFQCFRKFIDQIDEEEPSTPSIETVEDTFDKLVTPYKGVENESVFKKKL